MAQSSSSVDGLVSGLSTSDLISQLMQVERQSQTRLQVKKSTADKAITTYRTLNTKLATLKDAATALATSTSWQLATATSSKPDAVTATATTGAATGRLTFTVTSLASAQAQVSGGSLASTSATAATGPLTITSSDGTAHSVDVGDGSLASVVAAVNASDAGVRAAAVKVADGAYRLQLTAATTGAASAFTVDPTNLAAGLGSFGELTAAADAVLTVGDNPLTSYEVRSARNTVTDVLPGVTLNLKEAGATVTVDVTADVDGLADKVQAMVTAANDALAEIARSTAWNAETKTGGPLLGDSGVRRLADSVLATVTSAANGGRSMADAGVQLTRDGRLSFDRTAFLGAAGTDPAGLAGLFTQGGTATDPSVSLFTAGDRTTPGAYGVTLTTAATRAGVTGGVVAGGTLAAAETIEISTAAGTVTYEAAAGEALDAVAASLNSRFSSGGHGLVAGVEGGALTVRAAGYGASGGFTVVQAGSGAGQTGLAPGTYAGADAAGSFTLPDGTTVAATGSGQFLTAPTGAPLDGLVAKVTASAAGALGTLSYQPGLAQRLATVAHGAIAAGTGSITTAIDARQRLIRDLDDQITDWDRRLEIREEALKRQFSGLEVALGKLRDQSNWLAGQIAGLPTYQ